MTDNPFLSPEEEKERPAARPAWGGQGRGAPRDENLFGDPAAPPRADAPPSRGIFDPDPADTAPIAQLIAAAGEDPILAAATPIFFLLGSIRTMYTHPNPAMLRDRVVAAMRRFHQDARTAKQDPETVRLASYVLCASVDDAVMGTPWGRRSVFLAESLGAQFHGGVISGEKVFQLLDDLQRDAVGNRSILALMFVCISLGYLGQYAVLPRGQSEIETIRRNLYALLQRVTPSYELELSPHWRGESAPYRPGHTAVPVWVVFSVCVFILLAAWFAVWLLLGGLVGETENLPPTAMASLDRPPEADVQPPAPAPLPDYLRFLEKEIAAGEVTVRSTPTSDTVTVSDLGEVGLFETGSADLHPWLADLLARIGDQLHGKPWHVTIHGYTDNQPIHGWHLGFRSNDELSLARANAAKDVINEHMQRPDLVATEGHGERDPVTLDPAKRALNRRIVIVVEHAPQNGD